MAHKSRPTIADVARHAEVSTATVSRVLNATGPVHEETAERVRASVEALNYVPHAAARTLASRKTNTIGLLLPEIGGAFFQPLVRGVEAGVGERSFNLLIHTTQMPRPGNAPRRPLGEHNTDGLLIFTDSVDLRELNRLNSIGFPVVLLHQTPPKTLKIPYITIENRSGAQKIVEHLITIHNRRRILFLQGPDGHEDSSLREKGYRDALNANGLTFDPALITRGGFNRDEARETLDQLLLDGLDFDAVFSGDDDSAVGVLQALRQAGRKVPEEISVVGFDDQMFASTLTPPLTTVRAPTEQVGREAVHVLVRMIRGETFESRLVLPTSLVIRESCGCQI
jgi:LacI family transcriptional regulator, galactose operon repressor